MGLADSWAGRARKADQMGLGGLWLFQSRIARCVARLGECMYTYTNITHQGALNLYKQQGSFAYGRRNKSNNTGGRESSSVQYNTVQYSTVQYSTVQYSTVHYSTVQYSTVHHGTVLHRTVQYSITRLYMHALMLIGLGAVCVNTTILLVHLFGFLCVKAKARMA